MDNFERIVCYFCIAVITYIVAWDYFPTNAIENRFGRSIIYLIVCIIVLIGTIWL